MSVVLLGHQAPAHGALLQTLESWAARGWLRALDLAFARFLSAHAPEVDPRVLLAGALASQQLGRGHVALDLAQALLGAGVRGLLLPPDASESLRWPEGVDTPARWLDGLNAEAWAALLRDTPLVANALDDTTDDAPANAQPATPLVLHGTRLYLRRYWQYQQQVQAGIRRRLVPTDGAGSPQDDAALREALDQLFGPANTSLCDWQRVACALMARQRFGIVTGGPGTGKTTTVVRLLAALQHVALSAGRRPLRIRLAAPTGKAAARLNESIANAVAKLPLHRLSGGEALRAAIPTQASTVHRLLGSRPDTRHFRHNAQHPLPLDLLVIDEASMLDLELMAAVLAALPPKAGLVLLGDKDQLASVEAGAVLGGLCARADAGHYLPATADWVREVAGQTLDATLIDTEGQPLDQAVVKLRKSHRFDERSGIGQLADAVNQGDVPRLRALLDKDLAQWPDLARTTLPRGSDAALRTLVLEGYSGYLALLRAQRPAADAGPAAFDQWARQVLDAYAQFQVLCALREGPYGVAGLNPRVESLLRAQGLLPAARGGWYLGRPVLVTHNDPALGLMNGDIGVTLEQPTAGEGDRPPGWVQRVAFAAGDGSGGIRWVLPSRLNAVETVFAMTVHKSQGSEFTHVALVLPDEPSPVLTRELVYTGITRARQRFTLACGAADAAVLWAAVQRLARGTPTRTASGTARAGSPDTPG